MTVMPRDHESTVADLEGTPDDGLRYELVDGVLLVSADPSQVHQIVVGQLHLLLHEAVPRDCRVLMAGSTPRAASGPTGSSTRSSRRSRPGGCRTATGSTPAGRATRSSS